MLTHVHADWLCTEDRVVVLFYDFNAGGDGLPTVWDQKVIAQGPSFIIGTTCGLRAAARGLFNMSARDLEGHLAEIGVGTGPEVLQLFNFPKVRSDVCQHRPVLTGLQIGLAPEHLVHGRLAACLS